MRPVDCIKPFLRRVIPFAVCFAASLAVCATVFYLYRLPLEPVIYAFAVVAAGLILYGTVRFFAFYRKHKRLSDVCENISVSVKALPVPSDVIEEDYQKLIDVLKVQKTAVSNAFDGKMRDINDYYALWVHQIKTPIAAMRLTLESGESHDPRLSEQLTRIERYVDMALVYMRSESIGGDIDFVEVKADKVIKEAIKKNSLSFIMSRLALNYQGSDMTVLSDEKWLSFVLEQVISNAIKYTREGGVTVSAEDGEITVSDTGIGVRSEDLPRLGEKGFTGFNGREDKKATGLGLYLCKKILKKLDAQMVIDSVLGQGTTVKIIFNPHLTIM